MFWIWVLRSFPSLRKKKMEKGEEKVGSGNMVAAVWKEKESWSKYPAVDTVMPHQNLF